MKFELWRDQQIPMDLKNFVDPKALSFVLLPFIFSGCANVYRARESAPEATEPAVTAVYLMGDFGTPSSGFRAVARAIAEDMATDENRGRIQRPPSMIELGDNMYINGLPRPDIDATRERENLREMAQALARCRFRGDAVPLVLVPGNHDYDDDALRVERTYGDITRWFFLDDFGIDDLRTWTLVPRRLLPEDRTAARLYQRIYRSPRALVDFMSPYVIRGTGPEIGFVAIDSELLITLFDEGHDALAELYLERLRQALRQIGARRFRAVVAHHPLESYGNRPAQLGRFLLGPGWPQFPEWWQRILVLPPFAQLATLGRWLAHSRQDIHSHAATQYRYRIHRILLEEGVQLFFAGHNHNAQLIDLRVAMGGDGGDLLEVLSGNAANANHPVTSGPGTIFYYLGYGYARLLVFRDRLLVEMKDSKGEALFRLGLKKPPESSEPGPAAARNWKTLRIGTGVFPRNLPRTAGDEGPPTSVRASGRLPG